MRVAIACGGTGGHLFPGLAVAGQLIELGCRVMLLVSPKQIDQEAVKTVTGMEILTLPAIGLTPGRLLAFISGSSRSYRAARKAFRRQLPRAVLAMGGFTSAPPILAAKRLRCATFLHESNTIPGRANRWLSRFVDGAFVGFPGAGARLRTRSVTVTGTPVRPQLRQQEPGRCRCALGLDPSRPVILVMGGSQGASAINRLVIQALPSFVKLSPEWQWVHLCGPAEVEPVKAAYASSGIAASVHAFLEDMGLALGAATVAISRAGASSLAELAATRVPAVLVPYPSATDNHQYYNARAFEQSGAARLLEQQSATPESLTRTLSELASDAAARSQIQECLARWHAPEAASRIAEAMLRAVGVQPANRSVAEAGGKPGASEPLRYRFATANAAPGLDSAGPNHL